MEIYPMEVLEEILKSVVEVREVAIHHQVSNHSSIKARCTSTISHSRQRPLRCEHEQMDSVGTD